MCPLASGLSLRTLGKSHKVGPAEQPAVAQRPAPPQMGSSTLCGVPWEEGPSFTKAVASSLMLLPSAGWGSPSSAQLVGEKGVVEGCSSGWLAETRTPCQGDLQVRKSSHSRHRGKWKPRLERRGCAQGHVTNTQLPLRECVALKSGEPSGQEAGQAVWEKLEKGFCSPGGPDTQPAPSDYKSQGTGGMQGLSAHPAPPDPVQPMAQSHNLSEPQVPLL